MESRLKELLDKYWEAETSLDEEKEIRELLLAVEGFEDEKLLFGGLDELSEMEPQLKRPEGKVKETKVRRITPVWLNWAASILILVSSVWVWQYTEQRKAEKEAYEEVMMALAMIQTNLSKGKESMKEIEDLKYLNTTNQIFGQELMNK
ncbi:hypothetical protein [Algoriphagus sediminis]|uniref:Anti-sigma factor n=1 Tax=Algoriphagus sediminis TaxID=3057113 RepID=A0ABT7YEN0_9BACT|nr:hypothetical protein [Algoriphagus sediminis]MDN3204926.1 hypothetical protein [Algoriphagus sediminis]